MIASLYHRESGSSPEVRSLLATPFSIVRQNTRFRQGGMDALQVLWY
jgi:hypothetical protein